VTDPSATSDPVGGEPPATGFTPPPPPPSAAGFVPGASNFMGHEVSTPGRRFVAMLVEAALAIVTLGIGWLIWAVVLWSQNTGQTPAKKVMKMRCVRTDTGETADFGTMAMRELVGKTLLGNVTCGIVTIVSGVMILGETRQGVWDKLANTIVVEDPDERLAPQQ
jgi:uncharacterized RDD family membrane protein YckC